MGLWGISIEAWDRWCVWAMWVAAGAGAVAVFAGLFTGIVGHQISEISQREANARIAEANARGEEARRLAAASNEQAKAAELKLEQLRHAVAPRQLDRAKFLHALAGQPKAKVELVYLRDDPECFELAQQIWRALQDVQWEVEPPKPIPYAPASDRDAPTAMSVDGQPSGVAVVTREISEGEADAGQRQLRGLEWEHTPWTVLMYAIGEALGQVGGHAGGRHAPEAGILRIVVAPR